MLLFPRLRGARSVSPKTYNALDALNLQIVPYRVHAADSADKYARAEVDDEHYHRDRPERHDRDEAAREAADKLTGDELIYAPLGKERQPAAQNAEHQTLHHERQTDE